jgi:hypothetical protein
MIEKLKQQRERLDNQIRQLEKKEKLRLEKNKDKPIYTKILELGIEISQQIYNGKTYAEILKLVKEEQIANHEILFKLRSLTKKYPQFKDFWVYIQNPDKISKDNGHVARFDACSDWASLSCDWLPDDVSPSLGVFLWRKLK